MNNFFAFVCDIAEANLLRREFQFLFKAPGLLKEGDLSQAIESSAASVLAPDAIAIVCLEGDVEQVTAALRNEAALLQAANRLKNRIALYVCAVNLAGVIHIKETIRNGLNADESALPGASPKVFKAGLAKLFNSHHVLVTAPSGFAFVKPSGERSTRFLRAEDALTEVENVHFLSLALLYKIKERVDQLKGPIDVICIDTMAIATVAYALCDLYSSLYKMPRPRVVSFHSHEGLRDFDFPLRGTSLCIISASSSLRLERLWKKESQCHQSEVVTLLTFDTAMDFERALFALPNKERSNAGSKDGLRDIRIAGERFAPEDLKPKRVLLRKPVHASEDAAKFAKHFAAGGYLTMQGRLPGPNTKVRPLFLFGGSLVRVPAFETFLKKVLWQRVPISLSAIVHQEDEASASVANRCAELLQPLMREGAGLRVVKHSELAGLNPALNPEDALLIVAAVVGRGSKLLSVSRDLRELHKGSKTYLIGAQIAETQSQIDSLKKNLDYSAEKSAIHVATFAKVAVGESLALSYKREHEALSQLPLADVQVTVSERVESLLGTTAGLRSNAMLPSGANLTEELFIRPDFAYWEPGYVPDAHSTPAVLMTVAAILQQARDSKSIEHDLRLATDAFQQVILDPENFARYNDGVIQGAMLRAALPGELDYSSEREASRYMTDLMTKVFIQHEQPQGEAALEFALACYTGVLKLVPEHFAEMIAQVSGVLQGETPKRRLLRLLLQIDQPEPSSSGVPF